MYAFNVRLSFLIGALVVIAYACPDHYGDLRIPPNSTSEDARIAWIEKARLWHPELSGTNATASLFDSAYEAAKVLTDPLKKKAYDMQRKIGKCRRKREPLTTVLLGICLFVVVSGLITVAAETIKEKYFLKTIPTTPGCRWFGTAPVCGGTCPENFDLIRTAASKNCESTCFSYMESFGGACWSGFKAYCCSTEAEKIVWGGRWVSSGTGSIMHCTYAFSNKSVCGSVSCYYKNSLANSLVKSSDNSTAKSFCDSVTFGADNGRLFAGKLIMLGKDGHTLDTYYKI